MSKWEGSHTFRSCMGNLPAAWVHAARLPTVDRLQDVTQEKRGHCLDQCTGRLYELDASETPVPVDIASRIVSLC